MNIIYETMVGSTLYGLRNANSDIDKKGIFIPTKNDLLGLFNPYKDKPKSEEKIVDGVKVESVMYSLSHYLNLVLKSNPTVIELAFSEDKYKTITSPIGEEVMQFVRNNMITMGIYSPYRGYIFDQLKIVKSKKASNQRLTVLEKYKYDIKAASHVYRLAIQAKELLLTGKCNPTMSGEYQQICLKIKQGGYSFEECVDILDKELVSVEETKKYSTLKESIDIEKVNKFVIDIHEIIVTGQI